MYLISGSLFITQNTIVFDIVMENYNYYRSLNKCQASLSAVWLFNEHQLIQSINQLSPRLP